MAADFYKLRPTIKARYRGSIRIFDDEFRKYSARDRLRVLITVLSLCEDARLYDWSRAPEAISRKNDKIALKGARNAVTAIRGFSKFCRDVPGPLMWTLVGAQLETGFRVAHKDDVEGTRYDLAIRLAEFLEGIAAEIVKSNPTARAFFHRTRFGPLLFEQPIDRLARTSLPGPPTCLALFLSFLFRIESRSRSMQFQVGELIPRTGRPYWSLIQKLVQETLGKPGDVKENVTKTLGRHPHLRVIGYG
jgi:hypothetical protein